MSFLALLVLPCVGCATGSGDSSGGGGGSSAAFAPFSGDDAAFSGGGAGAGAGASSNASVYGNGPDDRAAPPAPRSGGPEIRVTWEALAVERDRAANPRLATGHRRPMRGVIQTQKIVLVSESHPEAKANRLGRTATQNSGVAVAPLPDADLMTFLKGLEQRGFFRVAQRTGGVAHLFDNPNSRGRITVERDGQSWSVVSMRGQGLNESTKAIPALYSELKQAVLLLRNRTPTLSVVGLDRTPLR